MDRTAVYSLYRRTKTAQNVARPCGDSNPAPPACQASALPLGHRSPPINKANPPQPQPPSHTQTHNAIIFPWGSRTFSFLTIYISIVEILVCDLILAKGILLRMNIGIMSP